MDQQAAKDDKLITVSELARFMAVTEQTVHNWIKDSAIPYVRVAGKTIRFRMSDIEEHLSEKKTGPQNKPTGGKKATRRVSSKVQPVVSGAHEMASLKDVARLLKISPKELTKIVEDAEMYGETFVRVAALAAVLEGREEE